MVSSVKTVEGPASRRGVVYEVSNGETIPTLGETHFVAESKEGFRRTITAHVADVSKRTAKRQEDSSSREQGSL